MVGDIAANLARRVGTEAPTGECGVEDVGAQSVVHHPKDPSERKPPLDLPPDHPVLNENPNVCPVCGICQRVEVSGIEPPTSTLRT